MSKREFQQVLDDSMMLLSDPDFAGAGWLTEASTVMWSSGPETSWIDIYQPLTQILYRLGLIGLTISSPKRTIFFIGDPRFVENDTNLEECDNFSIHPAFAVGLNIKSAASR
jgi:hypothetical protein